MNTKNIISNLQKLPLATRVRILWITVAVIAAALVGIWVWNLKAQVSRLDKDNLLPAFNTSITQGQKTIRVEWTETKDNRLKIYFKVNNNTNDILNLPELSQIKLMTKEKEMSAESVLDRQNKNFVKRVLSKTENYGVLTFPKIDEDKATVYFNQMYYEMRPNESFSEQLELNFKDLNQAPQLRK